MSALKSVEGRTHALHSAGQPCTEDYFHTWNKPPTPQPKKSKKPQTYIDTTGNQDKRYSQGLSIYNQGLKVLWKPNSIPIMPFISFPTQSISHTKVIEDRTKISTIKKSVQTRGGLPANHKYKMYSTSKRSSDNAVSVLKKGSYKNPVSSNRSTRSANQLASSCFVLR
jgi:hypothetical protein